MSQKIEFELAANDTSAKAAWERQQKAINAVIEKLGKLEDASAKAGKTQEGWVGKGVGKLAGMAAGYLSVTGAIGGVIAANKEMMDQADQAALKYDELFRKVNVQANMLGVAGEAGQKRILDTAIVNAATAEESAAIAKALAGSGFNAEQATGSALDAVLKAQAAMGQQGEGKGAVIAESVAKYMNSLNIPMTGENMKSVMVAVQQSAKAGFGKFEDMAQLSGKVGGFSGKADSADVLAAFNIGLLNSASADTASTGLKIFGDRLMGAKGDKEREGLLKKAGIKPEDVDFIGEKFDTVMERVGKAVEAMPEANRAPWMQKMFGTETAGFAGKLLENRGRMDEFRAVMGNEKGFAADVEEMTSGKAAARRRLGLMAERDAAEKDTGAAEMLSAADIIAARKGLSPAMRAYSRFKASTMQGLGFSPETAIGSAYGSTFGVKPDGGVGYLPGVTTDEIEKLLAENIAAGAKPEEEPKRMPIPVPAEKKEPAKERPFSAAFGDTSRSKEEPKRERREVMPEKNDFEAKLPKTLGKSPSKSEADALAESRESAAALREASAAMREAAKSMAKSAAKEPVKIVKPDVPVRPVSTRAGVSK